MIVICSILNSEKKVQKNKKENKAKIKKVLILIQLLIKKMEMNGIFNF